MGLFLKTAQTFRSNIHEPRYNPYEYPPPQGQYGAPPPQGQYGAPPPPAQYIQAAFQSSESSWSIYRGFSYLHARVILQLQDELRCLEDKLVDLDEMDLENSNRDHLMSRKDDLQQARREEKESVRAGLISTIQDKLVNYNEILAKARDLNAFQRPSNRDYYSFRTWFWNEKPRGMPGMDSLSIINNTGSECFANLNSDEYLSDKYPKLHVQPEADLRTWRGYLDEIWTLFDGPLDFMRVAVEKAQCLPGYQSSIRKVLRGACSLSPKVLALLMTANLIPSAQAQRHDLVREWGIRTTGAVTGGFSIPIAAMDPKTVSPGLWWGLIAAWVVTTVMFVATNTYVIPRGHRMRYLCTLLLVEGLFVVVFVTALIHDPVKMATKILANMPVLTVIIAGLLPLAFD